MGWEYMFLNRTRQIIGLDIGSHAIKMIALRHAKGELPFELVHFGVAELPEGTIVDGAIIDDEAVTQTITELFAQHKVKSPFVAASVSGNAVIVRRVTMPRQDADALRKRHCRTRPRNISRSTSTTSIWTSRSLRRTKSRTAWMWCWWRQSASESTSTWR